MIFMQTVPVQHRDNVIATQTLKAVTKYKAKKLGNNLARGREEEKQCRLYSTSGGDEASRFNINSCGLPLITCGGLVHLALFNIDKLKVGMDFTQYSQKVHPLVSYLQILRAAKKDKNAYLDLGDIHFQVLQRGRGSWYPYGLSCDGFQLFFSASPVGSHCAAMLDMSQGFLWRRGYFEAWNDILGWLQSIGWELCATKVSRCDLALHTDAILFQDQSLEQFVCRAKNRILHKYGQVVSGFEFGKGDIHSDIYNKSLYIRNRLSDQWFNGIWKGSGWDGTTDIWNIEFQLKAKYLRRLGLCTIEEVFAAIPDLWRELTSNWLSLREGNHSRSNRRQDTYAWQEIIAVADKLPAYNVIQNTVMTPSLNISGQLASITGSCLSLAGKANIATLDDLLTVLKTAITGRLISEGKTFKQFVENSAIRFS